MPAGIGLGNNTGGLLTGESVSIKTDRIDKNIESIKYAEVVSIELNSTEVENIGRIQFRFINELGMAEEYLNWAYPYNSAIKCYPVLHEMIIILEVYDKYFWLNSINYNNYVNNNYMRTIFESPVPDNKQKSEGYLNAQSYGIPGNTSENEASLGEEFQDNRTKIGILKPNEGDVILQGRFGNFMRFGNNPETNSPTIKIGNKDFLEYKIYEESLDEDSCVWITSDEIINFTPYSPIINDVNNPPNEYSGKQIFIFSDRIVLGAKQNEIIMYSNKAISLSSNDNFSVDTDKQVVIKSVNNTDINSKNQILLQSDAETKLKALKVMIGSMNANEPLVLGNKWIDIMTQLIDAIISHTHATGTGPSSNPINFSAFENIKTSIKNKTQISDDNFTTKKNG